MTIEPRYLRLSEHSNALDYLDRAHEFMLQTDHDDLAWKWVVLALHGALYGFAICACTQGNFENVLQRNKKGDVRRNKKGKGHLIGFRTAMKQCQDPSVVGAARALRLSQEQYGSISKLHGLLRNNFEHYVPKGWSIEIHDMPQIAMDVLDAICFLALRTGAAIHLTSDQKKRVQALVAQGKETLRRSHLYQEAKAVNEQTKDV